ncbi:MAG: YchJ family metal-binding protein [Congregibacter sp.]|nr:YchJ family metal-binding protein [Congregibacter sp.]MDP5070273.1 YchJ family metal-binding protein [Congregibacter sp.]
MDLAPCHCQSGEALTACCGPFLAGSATPQSAEQLMRSRYSAFVICDEDYLKATWHAETRPSRVRFDEQQRWLGLSIRALAAGGPDDGTGTVEFVARFKVAGKGHRLHEVSRFEKLDGRWYYLDGRHL